MSVAFVQDQSTLHDGVTSGTVSLAGVNGANRVFLYCTFITNAAHITWGPPGWTELLDLDTAFGTCVHLYELDAPGGAVSVTMGDGTGPSSNGSDGYLYILEVSGLSGTNAQAIDGSFPGSPPPDLLTGPHTANADNLVFHSMGDGGGAQTMTWDTSTLAADDGTVVVSTQGGSVPFGVYGSSKIVTYSTDGAKAGLGGSADGYDSFLAVYTLVVGGGSRPQARPIDLPETKLHLKQLPNKVQAGQLDGYGG